MPFDVQAALKDWRLNLDEADACLYVGPRPQTSDRDGPGVLLGRRGDLERINKAVLNRPLVILDGPSGVGKSSLLQNGLFSRLEKAGFAVFVSRKWRRITDPSDSSEAAVERYVAMCVRMTHEDYRIQVPGGMTLDTLTGDRSFSETLSALDKQGGAVLVLDQFEELLRQPGAVASRVVKWIINLAYRQSTRVVISLRTDSYGPLGDLLKGVKPFSMDRVRVEEVKDRDSIGQIILTPRAHATGTEVIAPTAAEELLGLWEKQKPRPKLLDLQATLYALYFRTQERRWAEGAACRGTGEAAPDSARIEAADVELFLADARRSQAAGGASDPFSYGLRESIRLKVEHAETASRDSKLDEYLVSGTRQIVRRAVPHLSSGDFKVPIPRVELAQRTLDRELRVLEDALLKEWTPPPDVRPRAIVKWIVERLFNLLSESPDYLTARCTNILRQVPEYHPAQAHHGSGRGPRRLVDVTAGPMMGSSASATLLEEIRRVTFAFEWLEKTEITRTDPDGTLALVHDGSGQALKAWESEEEETPTYALHQLTAARGEHYVWADRVIPVSREPEREDGAPGDFSVIANLNWRECRISTRFRRVVFVNCDFTGSRFDKCTFEGVTFVNCLLDDANFENCRIIGHTDLKPIPRKPESKNDKKEAETRLAPSFTVDAPTKEVQEFARYLEVSGVRTSQLFSDTSGTPAVPGASPDNHLGDLVAHFITNGKLRSTGPVTQRPSVQIPEDVTPTTGGVAMVGGRICFLTLYRCRSEEDGSFAFHHVSGDGLDIVEQYGGRIEIHDGAIRGISVSRDKDDESRYVHSVALAVNDSNVVNVYFSGELAGLASFKKSFLLMLINASENSEQGFQVQVQNCRYQCLVNTEEPDGKEDSQLLDEEEPYFSPIQGSDSRFSVRNREILARSLARMDYRAHPEMWEAAQRKQRARHE